MEISVDCQPSRAETLNVVVLVSAGDATGDDVGFFVGVRLAFMLGTCVAVLAGIGRNDTLFTANAKISPSTNKHPTKNNPMAQGSQVFDRG
jgi:hypothetical protein